MAREMSKGASTQMEQGATETVRMTGAWIIRLAEDERKRDEVRLRAADVEARKAELVRVHGQRLFDELRTTLVRDIDAFRKEFPVIRPARSSSRPLRVREASWFANHEVRRQFSLSRRTCPRPRSVASIGSPRPTACRRVKIGSTSSSPAWLTTCCTSNSRCTGQVFTNADALSEYLLIPVLTGRPL